MITALANHMIIRMYVTASLPGTTDPLLQRERLYLLAVGYYRSGDYSRSRDLADRCLLVFLSVSGVVCLSRKMPAL